MNPSSVTYCVFLGKFFDLCGPPFSSLYIGLNNSRMVIKIKQVNVCRKFARMLGL